MEAKFVGRGSSNQQSGRFEKHKLELIESDQNRTECKVATEYFADSSQNVISKNNSPDIHFNFSLNPYRGCSHGCSYCYARPTHEYLGWGPGIDFETKIVVKEKAPQLFRNWLKKRDPEKIEPVMLSGVTDCYQNCEKQFEITRQCLEIALEFRHPIQVITKNRLITRDLDILVSLAKLNLVTATISVTTLDQKLTKILEPRTSSPQSRLRTIAELSDAGIPTVASISPIIPGINDEEIPTMIEKVSQHGAIYAFYVMLRLPDTVKDVFSGWLDRHFPARKQKVLSRVQSLRQGKLNSSEFGKRMRGEGFWADNIQRIFELFIRKYGLQRKLPSLRNDLFTNVDNDGRCQKRLF